MVENELAKRHITLSQSRSRPRPRARRRRTWPARASIRRRASRWPATRRRARRCSTRSASFKTAYVRFIAGQTALEQDYAKKRGTTAELQKLYDANQKAFQNQACVTVLEVLAGTGAADASGQPVPPTAAQKAAALTQTNKIRADIKSDADFVKAAAAMAPQEGSHQRRRSRVRGQGHLRHPGPGARQGRLEPAGRRGQPADRGGRRLPARAGVGPRRPQLRAGQVAAASRPPPSSR